MVTVGSFLHQLPSIVRRDFGRWSLGGWMARYRQRFDAVIDSLIAQARSDPAFEERTDVLAVLLRVRDDNGEPIPDRHIANELLTLVGAGHETTANQLAWILEQLRRHPQVLERLVDEVDAGGSALRQATIYEAQRIRPSIEASLQAHEGTGSPGRVGSSRGHQCDGQLSACPRVGGQLPRPGYVQPGPIPRTPTRSHFGGCRSAGA